MILVTGANGNLGRRLLEVLVRDVPVRAVVRSERAAAMIAIEGVDVRVLDYLDEAAMLEAAQGCTHIVHLVGIIKESGTSTFEAAHEATTAVVARVARAAAIQRVIYLSILGATEDSANTCLASKARAEDILLNGECGALVIRVPMVLGEGDYASRALYGRAHSTVNFQLRASSLEQPIYAGDVVAAITAGINSGSAEPLALNLAGPESLSRRALTHRAAEVTGRRTRVVSIPLIFGIAVAWLLEQLSTNPPVSRVMLGVLDHDDCIDPGPALGVLGISLLPLNEALGRALVESPPT